MNIDAYTNSLILLGEISSKAVDISREKDRSLVKFKLKVITKPYDKSKPNVEQEIPIVAGKFQVGAVMGLGVGCPLLVKAKISVKEQIGKDGKSYESVNIIAVSIAAIDSKVYTESRDSGNDFDEDIPF